MVGRPYKVVKSSWNFFFSHCLQHLFLPPTSCPKVQSNIRGLADSLEIIQWVSQAQRSTNSLPLFHDASPLTKTDSKRKLAKDPNNTKWSRNTDGFGHKILLSQGWQPGDYLGAIDAPHAEFHTAANSSHVRAVLKEDNLGLGAKRNQGDECTGLDAFQLLLGRLNGKSEEALETERKAKADHHMNVYIHKKFGTMRFVKGGFLVGDQVLEKLAVKTTQIKIEDSADGSSTSSVDEAERKSKKEKKSKKRKAEDASESKSKERKKQRVQDDDQSQSDSTSRKRKDKKKRRKEETIIQEEDAVPETDEKARKKSKSKKSHSVVESTPTDTAVSTPAGSGYSTPVSGISGRHLARKRFIAQKRAAVMDQAALNQVCLLALQTIDIVLTLLETDLYDKSMTLIDQNGTYYKDNAQIKRFGICFLFSVKEESLVMDKNM